MDRTGPTSDASLAQAQIRVTGRPAAALRTSRLRGIRRANWAGWLLVAPALIVYVVFVLQPLVMTVQYSLYRWDGIGASQWVGLKNYVSVLTDPDLLQIIANAFQLILFFCVISVGLGLVVASLIRRIVTGPVGTAARTVLFLPQVIPLVAAGIAWSWVLALPGVVNQLLTAIGLGSITRAWLGDFGTALPAVGLIGVWVLLGLCTVLLLTGMGKIDPALYESREDRRLRPDPGVLGDHGAEPPQRDRRVHHDHGHRRTRELRHRVHLDGRRSRPRHHGARARDLPARLRRPAGGPRVRARRRARSSSCCSWCCRSSA